MPLRPIALMTDFGDKDPFVGIMKSVILTIAPQVPILDLCHEIYPGDIQSAAFALHMAFPYLPEDAILVAVVDPGVGTGRMGVAVELGGRIFVGPDNGLLSWIVSRYPPSSIVNLTNDRFFLKPVSTTFHARDIFAPVAAHLSKGVQLSEFGPSVSALTTFPLPKVAVDLQSIRGEVVYVDRFGNLVTNIERPVFDDWLATHQDSNVVINLGSVEIQGISSTYDDAQAGHAVAVFGSSGFLEIAVTGGSAAKTFSATRGVPVYIYHRPS